jgi:hypothetical protein
MSAVVFALALCGPARLVRALTFNYLTEAHALAGVGWYDYFGYIEDGDIDSAADTNDQSYASAYYDKIQFMGHVGVTALADAASEPNKVTLSAKLTGTYEFDIGWVFMECFGQDANSTVEGWLQVTEFPPGTPCSLRVNVSFPQATWTGLWVWQLFIESSSDYFVVGRDAHGDYGSLTGTVDVYAGEWIFVGMLIAGGGYADHDMGDYLGRGALSIDAALTMTLHRTDLNSDGRVDFRDYALFALQWREQKCHNPATNWCQRADIDRSSHVDAEDLRLFAQTWLLLPPEAPP